MDTTSKTGTHFLLVAEALRLLRGVIKPYIKASDRKDRKERVNFVQIARRVTVSMALQPFPQGITSFRPSPFGSSCLQLLDKCKIRLPPACA